MQDLCGLNIANSSTITVCIVQTEKIEFPAYASPSHCSCHLKLWKVNFAKTWVSFGELFDTLYWWASALFESCLLFLFHALYLLSFLTPRYEINHSSHSSQPHREGKVMLPSANSCFLYCQQQTQWSLTVAADKALKNLVVIMLSIEIFPSLP